MPEQIAGAAIALLAANRNTLRRVKFMGDVSIRFAPRLGLRLIVPFFLGGTKEFSIHIAAVYFEIKIALLNCCLVSWQYMAGS